MTLVDGEGSVLFETGVALAQYLIAVKETLTRRGVEFNIDGGKLVGLKNHTGPQTKMFNWNIIIHELDKIGVKTDAQAKIIGGDQESILSLFRKINASIFKLTDQSTFEIDEDALKKPSDGSPSIRRSSVGRVKKRMAREGVDILSMRLDRDPDDTESSLELILNLLCKSFAMKPKQAAALLTNNNQFLIHSIVKGVKGNYEPLIAFYSDIKKHMKQMSYLLEIETEQLPKLLNIPKVQGTLASGMYSQNLEICRHAFEVLITMNEEFSLNPAMFKQAHQWVVEKEGGLELALQALKRHPDLASDFINFVTRFSTIMNQPIVKTYKDEFRKLFQEPHEYLCVINEILPYLVKHQFQQVQESGLLDYWIDLSLEQAGLDANKTAEERTAAITLLSEIWLSYTEYVDKKADRLGFIQQVLKKAGRDRLRTLRLTATALMFRLLDKFAEEKNPAAPQLYKALIFSLIENPADIILREHYFMNFTYLFENHAGIPLNLLLDPLIKQIGISENVTFFYKVFDFDFFTMVAKHPKLTTQYAIPLANLLGNVYLNDVVLASAACVPLILLFSRFNLEGGMQEHIMKFETICLAALMGLEHNGEELQKQHQQVLQERELARLAAQGKKPLAITAAPEFEHKHGKPTKRMTKEEIAKQMKEQDQEATRRLKKSLIIQILLKLQNLKHEELNENLKQLLLSSNRRFQTKLYGYPHKGIMTLLRYWGDADTIMGEFMQEQDDIDEQDRKEQLERDRQAKEHKERREKEEKHQMLLRRYGEEMLKLRAQVDNGQQLSEDEERRLVLWEEKGESDLNDADPNVRDSMALMLYQGTTNSRLNAATMRNQKAMQQIDKIFRGKLEQEEVKRFEEERQKLNSQRRKQKLKEVLDKRKLELGVGSKTEEAPTKEKLIFDEESDQPKKQAGKTLIPDIKLLILEEEEDRDREAMQFTMRKYGKLWKNLYNKYSNSGFNPKNVSNFDQFSEKSQTISLGEMTKLLKDHNTFPNLIGKEELQTLFRLVNTKIVKKQDLQAMDYPAFYQLMMQLAYFCFTKEPCDLSHLPMVETINGLIKQFENATRSRGQSTVLYEDPDASSAADAKLIKALNDKLRVDPTYPIPEGYSKQLERTPIYDYVIPKALAEQMKDSKVVVLELLDQILNNQFGFHLLEANVKYEERLKVRQQIKAVTHIKAGETGQAEALAYMKKVERRKPSEGGQSLNPYASMSALEKIKLQQEVKPELSTLLQLEVAKIPIKQRAHGQEVAEVLEEILQAAEKDLKKLPPRANRAPGQVWNEAKQKREDDSKYHKEVYTKLEDKRKKRDELLKQELVKIKELREKEEEEKKKKEKAEKEKKKQIAKKADEGLKKMMLTERPIPAQDANKKADIDPAKREKEIQKKEVDLEKAKTERKIFMRRQKERMSQQFDQMIKEREEIVKKQEAVQAKEKELQQKIKVSMEAHVKETAPDRGKEQRERKQISEFLQQEEVQQILYRYEPALKQMFKFYASQDKKDVGFNLQRAMNTMTMRELIRFAYQQMIIPTLLQPEDIVQIFRQLMREKNEDVQSQIHDTEDNYLVDQNFAQIIEFEQFKKVLVRIATLAATENHAGGINTKLDQEAAIKKKSKKASKDLKLSEEALAKEDAFLDKINENSAVKRRVPSKDASISSQRSRSQMKNGLPKANTTAAPVTESSPQKTIIGKDGAPMINALTNSLRMSKEVKILRALEEKEQLSNHLLAQSKIDKDRKVRKEFNIGLIQPKTIEALLRFLELETEETAKSLDAKLNQHRIEIQGQKPNRIKKQLKNNKLEDYIRELPEQENENTMYGRGGAGSQMEGADDDVMQREDTVVEEEEQ